MGMKLSRLFALCLVALLVPVWSLAANYSFQPTPANLGDIDHHYVYSMNIAGLNLSGQTITSATISISQIYNWNSDPNILYMHLLDKALNTPKSSGTPDGAPVACASATESGASITDCSYQFDLTSNDPNDTNFQDYYASSPNTYGSANNPISDQLYSSSTLTNKNVLLASPSFTTTPTNYTYNFNSAQLADLNAWFADGDISIGLDPNCHFYNNGITFSFTTGSSSVPEPTSMVLLGTGLIGLVRRLKKAK